MNLGFIRFQYSWFFFIFLRQHLFQLSSQNVLKPLLPPSFISFPRVAGNYDYDYNLGPSSFSLLKNRRHFPRDRLYPVDDDDDDNDDDDDDYHNVHGDA